MGRIANRLLHYFKECWSECQPITPQLDDDFDDLNHRDNPLRKSTIITRDKNNNRKNYRQLAGLSDDEDEPEYTPIPSSKRVYIILEDSTIDLFVSFSGSSFSSSCPNLYNCGSRLSCIYCLS